ncbi:collagen alpha-1(II) chain-like [Stegodyphus dumicola]|uniref:collagen alpha-1(II) chain-like n=1 Tax=Stegodyphus dumicola TaxID=202533 RepID=UPI0015A8338A|nr:collagen alpha-1(II) chain-like [Stegodyphus dumicola]
MHPDVQWKKVDNEKEEVWFSSLRGGFKITYEEVGPIQLTFLRLLSQEAHQNFTYSCTNSIGWFNQQAENYDLAIRILGENGQEFSPRGVKPLVLLDGCKMKKEASKSIFEIRTTKMNRLPLVDFLPKDYGSTDQAFGFEVGPLCFS